MLPSWAREQIAVISPTWVEERGKRIPNYRDGSRTVVSGCSVQPVSATEVLGGRQASETRFVVYAPPGTVVGPHDAVEYAGVLDLTDGGGLAWTSPTGAVSHVVINLVDWEG